MIVNKKFMQNNKGFTIIELLVVISILALMVAIAVPNVGRFVGKGKVEAHATELKEIQTAVAAMLLQSTSGQLDSPQTDISDMDLVTADFGTKILSSYLKRLGPEGNVLTGCKYSFTIKGTVYQVSEP